MPLVIEKSFDQLMGDSLEELVSTTNITRTTPGSKARSLLQVVNRKLNKSYQEFDINFLRTFLPFAQGRFLDYIGDMLGTTRLGSARAIVSSLEENFKFSVASGTFGDLNSGSNILVPAGTQISSLPGNEGIVYRILSGFYLPSTDTEFFFSAEAVRDGSASNAGSGTLVNTTFTGYTLGTGLLVTNLGPINSGTDIESDNNFRFRLANQVLAAEGGNETSVRLAILSVPGVQDVISLKYARGIGTFDFVIQTIIPNTPDSVINSCQLAIERSQSYGIRGKAVAPTLTGMSFQISITWRSDTKTTERTEIKRGISNAIQDYINNLDIAEEFIYNELIQRILDVSDKIKNVGTAQQAIDQIFIYRNTKVNDSSVKEEIQDDYAPDTDERLIIEDSLETPVTILDKN